MDQFCKKYILIFLCAAFTLSCSEKVSNVSSTEAKEEKPKEEPEDFKQKDSPYVNYRASQEQFFRLKHTELHLAFDWKAEEVKGKALLTLSPWFYPQSSISLDAVGFEVQAIARLEELDTLQLEFSYDGKKLEIDLDKEFERTEDLHLYIRYIARPRSEKTKEGEAISSDRGLFFIPADTNQIRPRSAQIWTQGETQYSSRWFPTLDAPNQKMTSDFYLTVEDKYKTLSNGVLLSSVYEAEGYRTDHWQMDMPHAPYLAVLAIGEYAIIEEEWEDIPLSYWVEDFYADHAKALFGRTPEMLSLFSEKFGVKYPWPKYAQVIVRDFVSGAMENTSASVFMEEIMAHPRDLVESDWDGIIAHELAHHWFGDLVTCESWSNLPLNESFANYAEFLWLEHAYGDDEADYHALGELDTYLSEAKNRKVDLIRFFYDDKEDMFDSHSYAKGGLILHMLRQFLGDEAFFASLKLYLESHAFQSVEIHDLRLAFEKISGQDLNWFFNQWFLASGHPELKVRHAYDSGQLSVEVWQTQNLDSFPVYQLPLHVKVWDKGELEIFPIVINASYEKFVMEMDQEPDLVIFDAYQEVLAEVDHPKNQQELINQYYWGDKLNFRMEALTLLEEDLEQPEVLKVIKDALKDPFWAVRELALSMLEDYEGSDMENMELDILALARNDPKAAVRAQALSTLSSWPQREEYEDFYYTMTSDTSFSVVGIALFSILLNEPLDTARLAPIIEEYASYPSLNLVLPVATFYGLDESKRHFDWFVKMTSLLSPTDLWYFLPYFGEYLLGADEALQRQAGTLFKNFGKNHDKFYVRVGAFNALGFLEIPEATQWREQIIEEEKDPRVKAYYRSFTIQVEANSDSE